MIIRGNSIVNKPVIAKNSPVVLGMIDNILIDSHLCRIAAFTLRETSRDGTVVLPWMGVQQLGSDRVVAWAPTMIVQANELFDIRRLLKQGTVQPGTRINSADGTFLGALVDFFFNTQNGVILKYEVSEGPCADEHCFIPALANTQVKKDTNTACLPLSYQELASQVENVS